MTQQIRGQQKRRFLIMNGFLLGMVLMWFAGCAGPGDGVPRTMEADYGRSVTYNRLEMMVTPPDAVDPRPPVGMQPQAALNTQNHYDKSFEKGKEKPSSINLIIGGGQ
jgi:hypothetical protein